MLSERVVGQESGAGVSSHSPLVSYNNHLTFVKCLKEVLAFHMISTTVSLKGRNFPPHFPDRKVKSDKRLSQLPKFTFAEVDLNPEAPFPLKLLLVA